MPSLRTFAITLTLALLLLGCRDNAPTSQPARSITVFAAASLTDLVQELAATWQQQTGVTVRTSFAASSTLARQIEAGAPFDLYISADPDWVKALIKKKLLEPDSRRDWLHTGLVLVAPRGRTFPVTFDPNFSLATAIKGRLAIGDPTHVPAGRYAKAALEHLGWWTDLEPRLLPAADVRQALRLVEIGEADAGIVYRTDARASARIDIVAEFPPNTHPPITYTLALRPTPTPDARAFAEYLQSASALRVAEKHAFAGATARTQPARE